MEARRAARLVICLVALAALVGALSAGCGGSSSSGSSPAPVVAATPFYFLGDLVTGRVTALAAGDPRLAAADGVRPQLVGTNTGVGSALEVTSSDLLSYGGTPGWRALEMGIVNHMDMAVGQIPGGDQTGLQLIFTSLSFRNAADGLVPGGSVVNPDGYDPNGQMPIIHYRNPLEAGATATRQVAFQVPYPATQVLWGVIVRTDTALPGSFPRLTSHCYVTTLAGAGASGFADGSAHLAQFNGPFGLCVEPSGAVLIADRYNDLLREITRDGQVRTIPTLGTVLNDPTDVAVDEFNSTPTWQILYVTALGSDRVYRIAREPASNFTSSVTAVAGGGALDAGTTGAELALSSPYGIDDDPTGGFWLTDVAKRRVYQLRPKPGVDPAYATAAEYRVLHSLTAVWVPQDVSVDARGNAFILDAQGDEIWRRAADGGMNTIAVSPLTQGACVVNPAGTICYYKDSATDRVYQLKLTGADPAGPVSWTWEEITTGGTGYRDGSGAVAQFRFADSGLALDASGSLYATDLSNHCLRRIDRLAGE